MLALLFLLGSSTWGHQPRADSAGTIVGPAVRARMLAEGRARVLVEMRLPGGPLVPEGRLSPAAVGVQRSDIAGVRAQILGRLAQRNYRVLHQYSSVPLVALEIEPDALAELEASSLLVTRILHIQPSATGPACHRANSSCQGDIVGEFSRALTRIGGSTN